MEVLPLLQRAIHQTTSWMESALREENISHAEANILGFLSHHEHASINDAHHHFGHRRSTLTNLIDRLERRGLVLRAINPVSRRSVSIHLTDSGTVVARDVRELTEWLDEQIEKRVEAEDLNGFAHVLHAIEEITS